MASVVAVYLKITNGKCSDPDNQEPGFAHESDIGLCETGSVNTTAFNVMMDLSPYHAELAVASGKPTSGLPVNRP